MKQSFYLYILKHSDMENNSVIHSIKFILTIVLLTTLNYSSFSQNRRPSVLLLTGESIESSSFNDNTGDTGNTRSRGNRGNRRNTSNNDLSHFLNLVYDNNPTVYISKSGINVPSDETPIVVSTDPDDMAPIFDANPIFRNVELLTLKVNHLNDLDPSLNLGSLRTFSKLRYVYVESTVPITRNDILNFIQNGRRNITIIYKNASQS